jgi:hypothetical protein
VQHDHLRTDLGSVTDREVNSGVAGLELIDGEEQTVSDHDDHLRTTVPTVRRSGRKRT